VKHSTPAGQAGEEISYRAAPLLCRLGLGPRHHILQPLVALIVQLRTRQWLAWQHLVSHGRVIDKNRFNHRRLPEVARLQPLISVHVGMRAARIVIQRILNKLKTRNPDRIEGQVIGSSRVAHGERGDAEVLQRRDPLRKNRFYRGILLQVDAAQLSPTIVKSRVSTWA
jgi:hypothetical protein